MRNLNSTDPDANFIYKTDDLSASQWRSVMLACQAYEKCLLDDQRLSPENFASGYSEIPKHLLMPELERIHHEFHEESAMHSSCTEQQVSQSERYLILDEIRSGGMGQVFRAFDRACGRLVALKRIRKELAHQPQMKRRFLAEVELTADLEHPGVIAIYDQSVDSDGREFYVMRLIHGEGTGTLQQAISRFHSQTSDSIPSGIKHHDSRNWNSVNRAAFRKLIESVLVITNTIAHAHSRGIAHRDLKPSNILVGPYGETLIADWGLAKRINQSGTTIEKDQESNSNKSKPTVSSDEQSRWSSNSQGVGTPGFRAPELNSGYSSKNLVAADIYSLGAILNYVITRSVRLQDEFAFRNIQSHAPRSVLPLFAIAHKAMSREAANRYPSAHSMQMDLSNWLAGEPVSAYPESLVEQVWKWPSRHRVAASGIASALMIALIGGAWFLWFQRAQNETLSRALNTATALLGENEKAKRTIEQAFAQRESLALQAIIEFQSLLTLSPSLQSDLQFRTVRAKVLQESRGFYENLSKSFDQSEKTDASLARLTDAALALVLLENELGDFSAAIATAESACQRLRDYEIQSHKLEYHRGRMLAFKGNIETRHGWKKQGQEDQEQAMRHLEPLLDSSELNPKERLNAAMLWSRAASPFAIGLAAKGDLQTARELLEKILSRLNGLELDSFECSLLKIQSYGNLAMVRYFSKDTVGAYEALDQAGLCATSCQDMIDGSVPFREIVEFEVLRCTLVRFESDLMLTEGKTDPAIDMQSKSLEQLANAVNKYPGNIDIHNAYTSCITRLQTVLLEHGRVARANEIALAWLELAQKIHKADESNSSTREFLLLAYHTIGHLSEATQQMAQAQQHYREALSLAKGILSGDPQSERVLTQVLELNVHLIRFALGSNDFDLAQSRFEEAVAHASTLKSLPGKKDQYQGSINNQVQAALRFLKESDYESKSDQWITRLREAELLQ